MVAHYPEATRNCLRLKGFSPTGLPTKSAVPWEIKKLLVQRLNLKDTAFVYNISLDDHDEKQGWGRGRTRSVCFAMLMGGCLLFQVKRVYSET